ncbi:MAG TPA: DUF167 domain-containing protein [Casimicrobiaceae bacterium]|nr:DUF167 domain-containing protein [Casimicrobiaceae bacterium]
MAQRMIRVRVKPRARASSLEDVGDGSFVAHLKAAPVDGKANAELIGLVARWFGCSRTAVTIKSGAGARIKLLQITASERPA